MRRAAEVSRALHRQRAVRRVRAGCARTQPLGILRGAPPPVKLNRARVLAKPTQLRRRQRQITVAPMRPIHNDGRNVGRHGAQHWSVPREITIEAVRIRRINDRRPAKARSQERRNSLKRDSLDLPRCCSAKSVLH